MSPGPRGRLRDPPYFRRQCVCVPGKEAVRLSLPDFPFGAKIAERCQVCAVSGVFLLPRSSERSFVGLLPAKSSNFTSSCLHPSINPTAFQSQRKGGNCFLSPHLLFLFCLRLRRGEKLEILQSRETHKRRERRKTRDGSFCNISNFSLYLPG